MLWFSFTFIFAGHPVALNQNFPFYVLLNLVETFLYSDFSEYSVTLLLK